MRWLSDRLARTREETDTFEDRLNERREILDMFGAEAERLFTEPAPTAYGMHTDGIGR